jgi:hypothetical protein
MISLEKQVVRRPSKFHWALKRGCNYEHKRENFISLCVSCHRRYDLKPEWIEKAAATKRGTRLTEKHKQKISRSMKGKNIGNKHARKDYYELKSAGLLA